MKFAANKFTKVFVMCNVCMLFTQVIDDLCTECSSLIENHEKIQLLSAVHYNLGKTLQDVEHVIALPHEAALAEELLREDTNLLQVGSSFIILQLAEMGQLLSRCILLCIIVRVSMRAFQI